MSTAPPQPPGPTTPGDSLPPNVTWQPAVGRLTAGTAPTARTLSGIIVWGIRGLALLLGAVFFVGSLALADNPAWLALLIPPGAWLVTGMLQKSSHDQDDEWDTTIDATGISFRDTAIPPGHLPWPRIAVLRRQSRWVHDGGSQYQARWLEAIEQDGTVHQLPGVYNDRRWPDIIAAARAKGLVPDHVDTSELDE